MSDFATLKKTCRVRDPYKRLRYAHGLVLGEDELCQEQAYFIERDRQHQRALHGYGTVCGLALGTRTNDAGEPEIVVEAGLAVNPDGESIRVPVTQCAPVNDWLSRHRSEVQGTFGSPPSEVVVEIRLCYDACPTDPLPVPGGPCRTQADAVVPSRLKDSFRLELEVYDGPTFGSPPHPTTESEEMAIRLLGELLGRIIIETSPVTSLSSDELADLVRELDFGVGSPPHSPPMLPASIVLDASDAADAVRNALLVWVTEVRPRIIAGARGCVSVPGEPCVSLGLAMLTMTGDRVAAEGDITFDESDRPFLLPTRVLQEWPIASALFSASAAAGPSVQAVQPGLRVVVAGTFESDGTAVDPVIGEAVSVSRASGPPISNTSLYTIDFDGYTPPDSSHQYVVKCTPVRRTLAGRATLVELVDFPPAGIRIRVINILEQPVDIRFQVEVTEIRV